MGWTKLSTQYREVPCSNPTLLTSLLVHDSMFGVYCVMALQRCYLSVMLTHRRAAVPLVSWCSTCFRSCASIRSNCRSMKSLSNWTIPLPATKNNSTAALCGVLTHRGIVRSMRLSFLRVGHTHEVGMFKSIRDDPEK